MDRHTLRESVQALLQHKHISTPRNSICPEKHQLAMHRVLEASAHSKIAKTMSQRKAISL